MFCKQLITAILAFCLWGCASLSPVTGSNDVREYDPAQPGTLPEGEGWWYARFHIDWPEGEEISWHIGTLIGGEVIAPTFDEYYQDVA